MKAAVFRGAGKPLTIEEVELDPPKAGEVRVKIGAAGICRSDLHYMKGEGRILEPAVLGHEGSGTVIELGEGVTTLNVGDRVILSFVPNCGRCKYCLTGRSNMCDAHFSTGPLMFDGTTRLHKGDERIHHMGKVACFAQEAVVPESGCVTIPDNVAFPQAAYIGCCVTTGVGGVIYAAKVTPGSTVAVVGCGGVGLNVLQGARLAGATKIIAVDTDDGKLEFAGQFGATHFVNPINGDPVAAIKELTDGLGADFTFEAFGGAETIETAYNSAKKGGTTVVIGISPIGSDPVIN
ncbi:MAG: alcohol dehydrogenase catalytic domain-containing protein, partial [Chloroflexi bacterium]|nr:alcohol dehydrogenase catalytic domain-containing protein [Chloroflexota bacterium]